ncbi:MAG: hypothetical protein JWR28_1017 [Modestobacter sp.]|nr:hypothetical protein [Modestobacter sp.]
MISHPESINGFFAYRGESNTSPNVGSVLLAAGVCLSLIAQIAEQIDYLRFMPPRTPENSRRWWTWMVLAGPGWVLFGAIKQVIGLFLAVYIIANVTDGAAIANQPVHQFLEIYSDIMPSWLALTLAVVLVVISQVKINVTNAYSGSLAWTNSYTRITRHYPGRLVFLGVNLAIALVLMEANMFDFLNTILGFYANCGIAWVVVVASDIAINKYQLKISPKEPEFRRGMLYPINPVGFGSMLIAAGVSILVFFGGLGEGLKPYSPLVAIVLALVLPPVLAVATKGRLVPAPHPRRHRPAHVRRARQPLRRGAHLPRLRPGLRAARHGRLRDPRRARLLAGPVDRPDRRARPPRAPLRDLPTGERPPHDVRRPPSQRASIRVAEHPIRPSEGPRGLRRAASGVRHGTLDPDRRRRAR